MADIDIRHDSKTGIATIAIKDPPEGETRFRLRDTATGKYLSKRGWTKNAAFLPGDAEIVDGEARLKLDADLVHKIPSFAALEVEAPAAAFQQAVIWTGDGSAPLAVPVLVPNIDGPASDDEAATEPTTTVERPAIAIPSDPVAESRVEPTLLEPAIMHYSLDSEVKPEPAAAPPPRNDNARTEAEPAPKAEPLRAAEPLAAERPLAGDRLMDEDDHQPSWRPTAIAAAIFLVLGVAFGYVLFGGNDGGNASASNISNTTTINQAKLDTAIKERDESRLALNKANKELKTLKAAQNNGDDASSARIETMSGQLETASKALSKRESQLRDATAKVSVLSVQLEALQKVASDAASANLARQQNAEKTEANGAGQNEAASQEIARLKTERAQFQDELKTLQTEKKSLQTALAGMKANAASAPSAQADAPDDQQASAEPVATPDAPPPGVWGAAAIDQAGTIYTVQNQSEEGAAKSAASSKCSSQSQFRCEPLLTFSKACFSVARFQGEAPSSENFAYYVSENRQTAARTALQHCQGMGGACDVRFTTCSPDQSAKTAVE